MAKCDRCGEQEAMPYQCRLCGGTYCSKHRLPENHDCPGLNQWGDPDGVFDSGFDDSVNEESGSRASDITDRLSVDTGPGSVFGYFRGNLSFLFLALMWFTFLLELAAPVFGIEVYSQQWINIFTLNTTNPEYVWTWVTSIFAHSPTGFFHILVNSLVLYFFGPIVEKRIGSRKFAILFFVSGALAGLAQVGATILMNPSVLGVPVALTGGQGSAVLGASGAIAAVLGVLTVLNPNLRIYLYFVIPMPLWLATTLFAAYSIIATGGGIGSGGVAQIAHLAGLGIGLLYGAKLKRDGQRAPQQLRFGGGGPGGPGGPGRRR